jgi:hypothetical protein
MMAPVVRPQSGGMQASFRVAVPPFASSPASAPAPLGNAAAPPTSYDPPGADTDFDDASSRVSLTFPTFSNPSNSNYGVPAEKGPPALNDKSPEAEEVEDARESESNYDLAWSEDKLDLKSMSDSIPEEIAMDDRYTQQPSAFPRKAGSRRPIPILKPALWQIILFQISFMVVQILACISTIIDVATSRPTPTPMGTQHVALLLAGWGPVVVFGHLPVVRRNLKFWRPVVT